MDLGNLTAASSAQLVTLSRRRRSDLVIELQDAREQLRRHAELDPLLRTDHGGSHQTHRWREEVSNSRSPGHFDLCSRVTP